MTGREEINIILQAIQDASNDPGPGDIFAKFFDALEDCIDGDDTDGTCLNELLLESERRIKKSNSPED